jgi:homoserine dehydrogenase
MNHYHLALLGFGNVGRALARMLLEKQTELTERYGITFDITGIATGRHGIAIDRHGLEIQKALSLVEQGQPLDSLSKIEPLTNSAEFIQRCRADVLFESTPVNYLTGQPAVDYLRMAFQANMHAITANKGPVVHAYDELSELARKKGKNFFFESSVMDGAPIFSLFRSALPAACLIGFRGILNSTTNYILTRMEAGSPFDLAVASAQEIGIAETDPSGDIDGWDAAVKVAALVTVLMGRSLLPKDVERQGIGGISAADLENAKKQGKRWKLVCSARLDGDVLQARVGPEMLPPDSPLYHTEGTTSIVQFETDVLGLLTLIESDPSPRTTAYGLLADFINAVQQT